MQDDRKKIFPSQLTLLLENKILTVIRNVHPGQKKRVTLYVLPSFLL